MSQHLDNSHQSAKRDIFNEPLTRKNAKEAFIVFWGEVGLQALLYAIVMGTTTAIGLVIWVSAWFLVLFVPFGVALYYLFKKYQNS